MTDYKWQLGIVFSTREEFRGAVVTYAIHNGRNLKFQKNDKRRVCVGCKDGCEWFLYCTKQLIKIHGS